MKLRKREKSEREIITAMAARGNGVCGCGCNRVCPCEPVPTHSIAYVLTDYMIPQVTLQVNGQHAAY